LFSADCVAFYCGASGEVRRAAGDSFKDIPKVTFLQINLPTSLFEADDDDWNNMYFYDRIGPPAVQAL
jgi:hypothetical protein